MTNRGEYCYGCHWFIGSQRPAKCSQGYELEYRPWNSKRRYDNDWGWHPLGILRCKRYRLKLGPPDEAEALDRLGPDVVARLRKVKRGSDYAERETL